MKQECHSNHAVVPRPRVIWTHFAGPARHSSGEGDSDLINDPENLKSDFPGRDPSDSRMRVDRALNGGDAGVKVWVARAAKVLPALSTTSRFRPFKRTQIVRDPGTMQTRKWLSDSAAIRQASLHNIRS